MRSFPSPHTLALLSLSKSLCETTVWDFQHGFQNPLSEWWVRLTRRGAAKTPWAVSARGLEATTPLLAAPRGNWGLRWLMDLMINYYRSEDLFRAIAVDRILVQMLMDETKIEWIFRCFILSLPSCVWCLLGQSPLPPKNHWNVVQIPYLWG